MTWGEAPGRGQMPAMMGDAATVPAAPTAWKWEPGAAPQTARAVDLRLFAVQPGQTITYEIASATVPDLSAHLKFTTPDQGLLAKQRAKWMAARARVRIASFVRQGERQVERGASQARQARMVRRRLLHLAPVKHRRDLAPALRRMMRPQVRKAVRATREERRERRRGRRGR